MLMSQTPLQESQLVTPPPSSFTSLPLTPQPTGEKTFSQAHRVIALFRDIQAGRHFKQDPWTIFELARGEYDKIERQLYLDPPLSGYVDDKIRFDYEARRHRLVVRMPTYIHEFFMKEVELAIWRQLEAIGAGSGNAALFARKVRLGGSARIYLPFDGDRTTRSQHEPDATFWHRDATYPGIIIEVSYSQKRKDLSRLAETYLLDSDNNVRAVVGLDIEYGSTALPSRKATLSVWRTHVFHTAEGRELRVVQQIADEAFRDDDGNPTSHPGLRLRFSDCAFKRLAQHEIGDQDRDLVVSAQQLCQYLTDVQTQARQLPLSLRDPIAPGIKKRKRSETPPDQITSDDEARYVEPSGKA